MILSLIVTVFNKEAYIYNCLSSCVKQNKACSDEYEIIVVNDGSTDDSMGVVTDFTSKYNNIRVINQPNSGLSVARNNGVAQAEGDYFWFIDADDIISEDAVYTIIASVGSAPDIITLCAQTVGENHKRNAVPSAAKTGRDVLLSNKWSHCSPFYVFKSSFFRNHELSFIPNIYHEDSELTPRALFYAKDVCVLKNVLYYVNRDPDSITQKPRVKRAYDCIRVASSLAQFKESEIVSDTELRRVFDRNISILLNNALGIIIQFGKEEERSFNQFLMSNRTLFKSMTVSQPKYFLERCLFRLCHDYSGVYRTMKLLEEKFGSKD